MHWAHRVARPGIVPCLVHKESLIRSSRRMDWRMKRQLKRQPVVQHPALRLPKAKTGTAPHEVRRAGGGCCSGFPHEGGMFAPNTQAQPEVPLGATIARSTVGCTASPHADEGSRVRHTDMPLRMASERRVMLRIEWNFDTLPPDHTHLRSSLMSSAPPFEGGAISSSAARSSSLSAAPPPSPLDEALRNARYGFSYRVS